MEAPLPYTLVRAKRKTIGLRVDKDGIACVRAPLYMQQQAIDAFVASHNAWILQQQEKQARRKLHEPDEAQLAALLAQARAYIPPRAAYFAAQMGLTPAAVTITKAKSRFGSCSAKNRLCFSCRLMQYPAAAVDYVIVHEIAHIAHKHHGPAFYACIAAIMPGYQANRALLRD